jgi:hypothetical protein
MYETWSLTLIVQSPEEDIWTEDDEMVRGWRKVHNTELHRLYFSPNTCMNIMIKVKVDGMSRACGTHWGEMECV